MILWGKTSGGKRRFRCEKCLRTSIKKRLDVSERNIEVLFERWLLQTETLERVAKYFKTKASAVKRKFEKLWNIKISPLVYKGDGKILMVDGIILKKNCCILIAIDGEGIPITWYACSRENFESWMRLFGLVKKQGVTHPLCIVSDAQKGLIQARKWVFGNVPHQRCMTHVVRLAQAWLTRNPKLIAGKELLLLVNTLYQIKNVKESEIFKIQFIIWCEKYNLFLKEKSYSPFIKKQWYIHRRLRAVRTLLKNAVPDLFTFLKIQNIPRTTNKLEGGVNSPIKALTRHHRGMKLSHRQTLVFRFLRARQTKKYQH